MTVSGKRDGAQIAYGGGRPAHLDTTGSDDTGPAKRLRRRLVRMLAYVILPVAGLLLGGAPGYLNLVSYARNSLSRPLVRPSDSHMAISAFEWWAA
jgi:hypothetical protein